MSVRLGLLLLLLGACAAEEEPPVCGDGVVEGDEQCDDGGSTYRCSDECNIGPSLTTGDLHTCFVRTNGAVACWGRDLRGESSPPSDVMFNVAAGDLHTCGLLWDTDDVTCWGEDHYGYNQTAPPSGEYRQLSAGVGFTCALTSAAGLVCWGLDDDGQASPPDTGSFTSVTAGDVHACALGDDGLVTCWGAGLDASDCGDQCGQSLPPNLAMSQISAGGRHTCGVVAADASLRCWGDDAAGQLTVPTGRFTMVAAGSAHTCAIAEGDGSVSCWGRNTYGQTDAPAGAFALVSAGGSHSCGLRPGGLVECWGAGGPDDVGPYHHGQSTVPAAWND